jgi:N-glycosidase YbiA
MTEPITAFRDRYAFLSNFHPVKFEYNGFIYNSAEHAFQAAKAANPAVHDAIALARTPGAAKALGRTCRIRPGWDRLRLQVMEDILRRKFSTIDMRRALMATGDAELVEGNWWGDTFWGVCNGRGHNHLGKILMKLRKEWQ